MMIPDDALKKVEPRIEEAVRLLFDALEEIPDSRKARGVRFPQHSILALCVVAFICGRENLTQVMRFGRDHPQIMYALGFSRKKPPSVPTLSRVLGKVKAEDFQQAVGNWFASLVNSERKRRRCKIASVDGKASRSAGVHVLNIFLHDVAQVIWQVPVSKKENEITAVKQALPALLKTYPFLRILTGDALFAGSPLCSQIIENGRHYLFQIKGDQPQLLEKFEILFAAKAALAVDETAFTGEKKRLRHRA